MYECSNKCGYTNKGWFGVCPRCKAGVGEESEDSSPAISSKSKDFKPAKISKVSKESKKVDRIVKNTDFPTLNKLLSSQGGFVESQVIALGASPGTGKSTLCSQLCDHNSLYIGTEESYSQINSRFLRINPNSEANILEATDIEQIIDAIERFEGDFIVVDSLNNINNGLDWYTKQANNLNRIVRTMKENNKFGIIITQVTKSGEISGMNTIMHTVDTVLYLERSDVNNNLILYSNKNRFGEIGSVAIFSHSKDGLVEISNDFESGENEIGVSHALARFGYRNLDIFVEALVTQSGGNYGLRKANGLNQNRLQQIIGIIQYNASIDLVSKDVYVAISNGLNVNDTKLDLAIANSILSSYFKKPNYFDRAIQGELSLNGRIKFSNIESLKHIKDLISIYK